MKTFRVTAVAFMVLLLMTGSVTAFSQPSGGPYGPVKKQYVVPSDARHVYYAAPNGDSASAGAAADHPTTLTEAIARAVSGDAVILRGGTYRTGGLELNQGITIQPYKDEEPVLKGTLVAAEWKNLGNGLWSTKWTRLFPSKPDAWWQREREGKKTPQYRFNNDMVFVDGKFLQAVGWEGEVTENSYCIDYDAGVVYIGIDPTNRLMEITAYNSALVRTMKNVHGKTSDKKGYTLRGITLTQYAYRALEIEGTEPERLEDESAHGKEVVGTTIEDCTITFCSRVAGYFRGDHFTMKRCRISDTSTEGVYVIGSSDVLLEKNIFSRNNIENITGYYPAAVKIFNQSYRVTCNDNLVIDLPNSNGIWYDVGNVDGVFTNNWIEGVGVAAGSIRTENLWPSDNGFFFEISKGAVCAGNVFVNCDHGVMILNSANVRVYQNTFVNSIACIGRNARVPATDHFGWHSSTAPDVDKRDGHIFVNNLLAGTEQFIRPLMFIWQPPEICTRVPGPQLAQFDYNQFVRAAEKPAFPVILWSPAPNAACLSGFDAMDSLARLYPGFALHSSSYAAGYHGPLFRSLDLGRVEPLHAFPGVASGRPLPADIARILGVTPKGTPWVGAYPPTP
jgi:hypothetical protein